MASLSFFQAPGGAHLALSGEKRGIAFAETPLLRVSFCAAEGGRGLEVSPPHPFLSFRARFRGCLSAEKVSLSLTATQLCIHFPKIWPAFACPSSSGVSLRPYDINSLSLARATYFPGRERNVLSRFFRACHFLIYSFSFSRGMQLRARWRRRRRRSSPRARAETLLSISSCPIYRRRRSLSFCRAEISRLSSVGRRRSSSGQSYVAGKNFRTQSLSYSRA